MGVVEINDNLIKYIYSTNTNILQSIKNTAENIYKICNCNSYIQIDFILEENDILYFLKIDSQPNLSSDGILYKSVSYLGIDYPSFIKQLIEDVTKKQYM